MRRRVAIGLTICGVFVSSLGFAPVARASDSTSSTFVVSANVSAMIVVDAPEFSDQTLPCTAIQTDSTLEPRFCVADNPVTLRVRSSQVWNGSALGSGGLRVCTERPETYADTAACEVLQAGSPDWAIDQAPGTGQISLFLVAELPNNEHPGAISTEFGFSAVQTAGGMSSALVLPITLEPVAH